MMAEIATHRKGIAKPPKFILVIIWSIIAIVVLVTFGIWLHTLHTTDKKEASSQPVAMMADYPICAGGSHDFSRTIAPGEVKVDFRPDCRTEVTLPPGVVFRTDPSADIEIIFIDGSQYVDGPGYRVWYGLKRGIFEMHGIKKAGILKITFEKS
ncbi:MAG: hypothetical protein V3T98_01075 [Candidatus Paceibacterota bacterium]